MVLLQVMLSMCKEMIITLENGKKVNLMEKVQVCKMDGNMSENGKTH